MLERINFKRITRKGITYELDPILKTAEVVGRFEDDLVNIRIPKFIRYRFRKYKVTTIRDYAFYNCTKLTSVTIPNGVTYIGIEAFYNCNSLMTFNFPDSVTDIGYRAFFNCEKLTSGTIGNSLKTIGWGAFEKCSSLSSITIPGSVTSIGWGAFEKCSSLSSITIGSGVQAIREYAFLHIGLRLPKRYTEDGKLIAYKGFNADMTCRGFQYEEGKTYELEGEIELCGRGFHACTNPLDVFNYYSGVVGKDVHIHEVYLSGDIDDNNEYDSKACSSIIEIGRRLTVKDINDIINSR